jgi:hypothetical protein
VDHHSLTYDFRRPCKDSPCYLGGLLPAFFTNKFGASWGIGEIWGVRGEIFPDLANSSCQDPNEPKYQFPKIANKASVKKMVLDT